MRSLLIVASFLILLSSAAAVDSNSDDGGGCSIEWKILTKKNFSSQIRLHPHLLVMVTVPWSGESRFLMKELAHAVTHKQEKLGTLKLMLIYRNDERMLAESLGAKAGIALLYYHHSVSYKYHGRLRTQNILSSIYFLMSHFPEELPLKSIHSPEDLKAFLGSTDKAIILLEFCGWTPRLMLKEKKNATEDAFHMQGMETEKLTCTVENGFSGIPLPGEFRSLNDSSFLETENIKPDVRFSCTFEEFQRFDSFFSKFITFAREFFLPPERQRYGLVSERSLLSSLGVEDSSSWLAMLYFSGCPGCSKFFKEGDDFKSLLQMHNSLVTELDDDGYKLKPALPADKPSVILFVDRSSDSSETTTKSKEALDVLRKFALNYQISHQMGEKGTDKSDKSSLQAFQASKTLSGNPRLELASNFQNIKVEDKMSFMIKEGKQGISNNIASDLQSSSLHEILAYFLQKKKGEKLSSIAKDMGFELLSDDFDLKIEALPSETKVQSNLFSPKLTMEGIVKNTDDFDMDRPHMASISATKHEEISIPTNFETSSEDDEKKTASLGTSGHLLFVDPDQFLANHEAATAEDVRVKEEDFSQVVKLGEGFHLQGFKGSFFFSDGGHRLLSSVSAGSKIPSMVIVDPLSQQHYVFPEDAVFSYSSLADFINGFLNGTLIPYQRSEFVLVRPRGVLHPPFLNRDFHEIDSIPRVTTLTFSHLVLGFNESDSQNTGHAWKKDVLVLFSNSWCGFCQRMELVVREAYRALEGYANILKSKTRNVESVFNSDNLKETMFNLPLIYVMDCTLNECSSILKSMGQMEVYPALMLFPAERKNALSYKGDLAVYDVIKFIADFGSNSHHLIREKGTPRE